MSDEIADGDRHETGADRGQADQPGDRQREADDEPEEAEQLECRRRQRRQPEEVEPELGL